MTARSGTSGRWQDTNAIVVVLTSTLYCFVLIVHWLAFLTLKEGAVDSKTASTKTTVHTS